MFTVKQKEFLRDGNHRWNIKSGATRSGKTYLDYFVIPKRIRALHGQEGLIVFLGNTKGTLSRNIIEPLQSIWGDKLVSNIGTDNKAYLFGEQVYCLGADKVNQVDKLRGSSIKYCYGDEIVTWNKEVFEMLKSRLDKSYSIFDGTCNPDNPNHWFKLFLDEADKRGIDLYQQHYSIDDNPYCEIKEQLKKEYANSVYYDRYILGLWVRAEGIIFPLIANNPDRFITEETPKRFKWCEVGFDIGGNKSAYALTCTAEGTDGIYYVLKSQKTQADKLAMEDIEQLVKDFCEEIELTYNTRVEYINTDHVDVIINTLNDNTKYRAGKTYKPPTEDRPISYSKLMAQERIKFVKNKCDDLIEELQNLVFDDKSDKAVPLDDGTMQIDTYDSFTYSLAGNWNYLNI